MLKVEKLTKKFKEVTGAQDVSFEVRPGEVVGLLGENGAGKTTTLRMISTLLKPTSGTAIINGVDILENPEEARGNLGILFGGEVGIYDRLTARENIMYFARLNGMGHKEANERIKELINEFDMSEYIDRRVGKFSRGMKQKVSIARSIVHNPQVMLFDEPSTGLDVTAARLVQDFIIQCKKNNRSIVLSSHSMAEVEKLCDRIVVINKGRIVEEGTVEELKYKHSNTDMEEVFVKLISGEKNV